MRFKKFSIIISLALVVVCLCSFVAPSAQASFLPGSGDPYGGFVPYIASTLGDWIISQGFDWMLDQSMDVASFLGGLIFDDICPYNTDSHRHDFKLQNIDGDASRQVFVCQHCGKYGSEVLNEAYAGGETGGFGFVGSLPVPKINSEGKLLWSPDFISLYNIYPSTSSITSSFDSLQNKVSFYVNSGGMTFMGLEFHFGGSYPITGIYDFVPDSCSGSIEFIDVDHSPQYKAFTLLPSRTPSGMSSSGTAYVFTFYTNDYFNRTISGTIKFSYPIFTITPASGLIDPQHDETYSPDTRPASFTGDFGILGDNGQLTKVEGDQIFNETTNNYYNPSTGTTSTVTDWFYDYSDRSYHLTTESGDTVTVTYDDENITIQEGDTTYNVYYIIDGSASSDPCPEGGAHNWQAGETVDATCTVAGFKTETCSKCGEERTTELPALGHKWKVKQSVQTKYDENGELLQEGYTIYECERCGEQYKSTDSSGPPGGMNPGGSDSGGGSGEDSGDKSIWDKLGDLLGTLGNGALELIGSLISKLLDGLISLAELIAEKLVGVVNVVLDIFDAIPVLFTGFLGFLSAAFPFIPADIMLLLTFGVAAIVFIGIIKAIRR